MYKNFYNLHRNPFDITPDPSFLFPTRRHNEALASLYYGVRMHKGFVVMTGEVGTGKTLLVRCLLSLLKRCHVSFAYVVNPLLSPFEFIRYLARDFGLVVSDKAKDQILLDLTAYLGERERKKLTTLLVVDEAHHLSVDVLEEIRLLTNLETTQQKLLQILLVGQPELDQKLDSHRLRQLKQRITLRCHLEALNEDETGGYIRRRLELAGANSHAGVLFSDAALAVVYYHSRGIPRLINTLCENTLLNAYAAQASTVTPDLVEEAAVELRLQVTTDPDSEASASDENNDTNEILQALKKLLQLHDYMRSSQEREESTVAVAPGSKSP